MKITLDMLNQARTEKGFYTKHQVAWGQKKSGCTKWKMSLVGLDVTDREWLEFVSLARRKAKKVGKAVVINAMSVDRDGFWNPKESDIPEPKVKTKKGKLKGNNGLNKRQKKALLVSGNFYESREWRDVRYRVLRNNKGACMCCGRTYKDHGVILHVDHIKPRSKYPEHALTYNNLQLLCEDCNLGKSNKFEDDWRPEAVNEDEYLDLEHLNEIAHFMD